MNNWTDKVVLVTGGSAGLGLHIARTFHDAGAKIVLVARDQARLLQAAKEIGERVDTIVADITDQTAVDRLFERLLAEYGGLDVLVNCAGKSARGAIELTTVEDFRGLLELNFLALVRCTHAALPHLQKSGGHLVNIGSLSAKTASKFLGAYPASKFPVAAYSQQLRLELGGKGGIHVLLVCPGPIQRDDAGERYQDASIPDDALQPGGGVKLKGIDPVRLSRQILVACDRRKPELVVPCKARLLFAVSQVWPRLGDWLISRMTR